jgi:predicted protein tyrosine phosphatase
VWPRLGIADIEHVRRKQIDADRIITVCQEPVADNVSCAYEWYNMSDGSSSYGGECSQSLFDQAAASLVHALERWEYVLIHCHRGRSRSVAVAAAALAVLLDKHVQAALEMCRHPEQDPDEQLIDFATRFVNDYEPAQNYTC